MNAKLVTKWTASVLIVVGLLLGGQSAALATNPIGGKTHSFGMPINVGATANDVRALSTGDLDHDGHFDLVYGAGSALAVIENDETPLNGWPAAILAGTAQNTIADLALADFDHDGWLDIVSVTSGSGNNEVKLWQNPTMPFTSSWTVSNTLTSSLSASVTSVAVADLDMDGFGDLVTGGSDGNVRLWANPLTSIAPFTTSWGSPFTAASASAGINDLTLSDVDRDGRMDIVTVAGNTVQVWRNPGTPFTIPWTESNTLGSLSNDVDSVFLSDLDNDGWIDVAVGDEAGNVILWHNPLTPTAPFATSWGSGVDVGDATGALNVLFAADLDNDGDVDLISASGSSVQTWQNDGTPFSGTWARTTLGTSSDTVYALGIADVDHDGSVDVVSGSGTNEDYEIILWPNTLIRRNIVFDETGHVVGTLASRFQAAVSVDLDGDGDLDLLTGGDSNPGYELIAWENDGTPFETGWSQHNIGGLSTVYAIAVGDLDHDGDIDIVSGQDSPPRLLVWENDGTPFEGSWNSNSVGTPPTRVEAVAVGDLDNDGDLDIVSATGLSLFLSSDDYKVIVWENSGSPFTGTWSTNDVYTVTYSVHDVAVGDLDNDGWLDIVAGVNTAPAVGSASDPAPPEDWYPNYELRAYQNDGTPFSGAWSETNVGRDPETVTLSDPDRYHGYWGATVYSVALADLDNDGDLDIISGEDIEGDYQIKAWENDGTPFDGQPQEQHWTWQPTAVWVGPIEPWMTSSVHDVTTGDVNSDGYTDLITASGEFYETVVWENDGRPFGSVITDTTWIRYNLGRYTSDGALSVAVGDLDQDGDLDVVHGSGLSEGDGDDHDIVAWENQGGSVTEEVDPAVSPTATLNLPENTSHELLMVTVTHNGMAGDNSVELKEWNLLFEETTGDPLTSDEANALIDTLWIYRQSDGVVGWQITDTMVLTVTNLSLTEGGVQTISFTDGATGVRIAPAASVNFYVVARVASEAGGADPRAFQVTFDPDADSIVEDRAEDTSVSIQDSEPTTAGTFIAIGPPYHVSIEYAPDGTGGKVLTTTVLSGDSIVCYSIVRDRHGNFLSNDLAFWYLIDITGGIAEADLYPYWDLTDSKVVTFTGHLTGTAKLRARSSSDLSIMGNSGTVTVEQGHVYIEDQADGTGSEVITGTLLVGERLTVHAIGRYGNGDFSSNVPVTWTLMSITGGIPFTDLVSALDGKSATFTPSVTGTVQIFADHATMVDDSTGVITVSPSQGGKVYLPIVVKAYGGQ